MSRDSRTWAPLSRATSRNFWSSPVEAFGQFAGRWIDWFDEAAAGLVGGGDLHLAFRRLLELGIGQHAGQFVETILAADGVQRAALDGSP